MHSFYLAALLVCVNPELPDGTLIFLENSNRFVELYTAAKITHVGVVLNADREPWVYEATPGKVRRVRVDQYYGEMGASNQRHDKVRLWVMAPNRPYNDAQVEAMRKYLDSQLNRRYSIKNYIRNRPGDGIHCAELAASTLAVTGLFDFGECYDECPQSVFDQVKPNHRVVADFHPAPPHTVESWCARSQHWWSDFFGWCRWSCYETWTFCR